MKRFMVLSLILITIVFSSCDRYNSTDFEKTKEIQLIEMQLKCDSVYNNAVIIEGDSFDYIVSNNEVIAAYDVNYHNLIVALCILFFILGFSIRACFKN